MKKAIVVLTILASLVAVSSCKNCCNKKAAETEATECTCDSTKCACCDSTKCACCDSTKCAATEKAAE